MHVLQKQPLGRWIDARLGFQTPQLVSREGPRLAHHKQAALDIAHHSAAGDVRTALQHLHSNAGISFKSVQRAAELRLSVSGQKQPMETTAGKPV